MKFFFAVAVLLAGIPGVRATCDSGKITVATTTWATCTTTNALDASKLCGCYQTFVSSYLSACPDDLTSCSNTVSGFKGSGCALSCTISAGDIAAKLSKQLKDQGIPLGGFRKLSKGDLAAFLDSITSSSVASNATALMASLTKDGANQQLQLPPGIATKVAAAKLTLQNLGTTATKAVVQALQANQEGFQKLGLPFKEARKAAFLFAADRWTAANEDANGQPFSFRVFLDGVTSGLVVRTYTEGATDGVDVTTDGGSVNHLGGGNWECNVAHTSAFSGEIVDSTSGSGGLHPLPVVAYMVLAAVVLLLRW